VIFGALRRFGTLLVFSAAGTAALSVVLGLLLGASLSRALSVGFYLVGCLFLISGFFVGNRGPVRATTEAGEPSPIPFISRRSLRWATADEREDSLNFSALFVALGIAMLVIGVAVDSRHRLY
jgi:hypothetical protein